MENSKKRLTTTIVPQPPALYNPLFYLEPEDPANPRPLASIFSSGSGFSRDVKYRLLTAADVRDAMNFARKDRDVRRFLNANAIWEYWSRRDLEMFHEDSARLLKHFPEVIGESLAPRWKRFYLWFRIVMRAYQRVLLHELADEYHMEMVHGGDDEVVPIFESISLNQWTSTNPNTGKTKTHDFRYDYEYGRLRGMMLDDPEDTYWQTFKPNIDDMKVFRNEVLIFIEESKYSEHVKRTARKLTKIAMFGDRSQRTLEVLINPRRDVDGIIYIGNKQK